MKTRYLIVIMIAGIILTVMSAINFLERPKTGDAAPAFALRDAAGVEWTIGSFRGKPVFLHFWATWCGTCLSEIPVIEKIYQEFKESDVAILSVLTDDDGIGLEDLKDRTPISYPVLLDVDGIVSDAYRVWGVPESFIIDANGVVIERFNAPVSYDALRSLLNRSRAAR